MTFHPRRERLCFGCAQPFAYCYLAVSFACAFPIASRSHKSQPHRFNVNVTEQHQRAASPRERERV
eukprot:scaffold1803_cov171-Isochrysis_galbana.AAC.1